MTTHIQDKYKSYLLNKSIKLKNGNLISYSVDNKLFKTLEIECNKNHRFFIHDYELTRNLWCPTCFLQTHKPNKNAILLPRWITEHKVRVLLESKFNILLKQQYIKYNHKGYYFDGYNEEHKIAFEYQGYQHYSYPNHWHKTEEDFNKACQRDKDKVQYCIENNIRLITIPYTVKDLNDYIQHIEL